MIHYIEYDPATGEGREIDPFKSPDLMAVVRCRDCKEFTFGDVEYATVDWCDYWSAYVESPDGFCAWGERRTDE